MANGSDSEAPGGNTPENGQSEEEQSSAVVEFEKDIRETLAGSGERIFGAVKDHFVDREVQSRVDLLVKAFEKLREMAKEIKKIRPDHIIYDLEKNPVSEGYTKTQLETLNKTKEKRDKLVKATNKALKDLDYDGLRKALGN